MIPNDRPAAGVGLSPARSADLAAHTGLSGQHQRHLIDFFAALDRAGIRYCHWKSNAALDRAMAGKTDLDLLVDRYQAHAFHEAATGFGFKLMRSPAHKQYPAMADYLGFDEISGQLSHLHVHYRLVLGEDRLKGYRLPVEAELLAETQPLKDTVVPSPAWELAILIVRVLLKLRAADLLRGLLRRTSPVPPRMQQELQHLAPLVTREDLREVLAQARSILPEGLILDFYDSWQAQTLTPARLYRLSRALRHDLDRYRWAPRRPGLPDLSGLLPSRLLQKPAQRKQMVAGGVTIAFIGADGAGKSTVMDEITRWLRWKLDVQTFYMGSRQPSLLARCAHYPVLLTYVMQRVGSRTLGQTNSMTVGTTRLYRFFYGVEAVALAFDRRRRYYLGCRAADRGALVLFDRFPLPEVHDAMDGPRLGAAAGGGPAWLARLEIRMYNAIGRPDHIIALQASPEVVLARKGHPAPEKIIAKSRALRRLEGQDDRHVTHIDAEMPLDRVLLAVKETVWKLL